ncbi:MAG: CinA family protein [Cytophagaceae bacterium]|nr:MAG: CinA family protein [Cytophagaceae bacterium]
MPAGHAVRCRNREDHRDGHALERRPAGSALAEHIAEWEASLPGHLKLAYLPSYGMVRLRITGTGSNRTILEEEIDKYFTTLQERTREWLVSTGDLSMVQTVSALLRDRQKTLGTAESCTGGYIAHLITSEAGSSDIFNGAIVSYANDVKKRVLQVQDDTLQQSGAVSEQTVIEMVQGAIKALRTDYCIATSGIMGPGGGTPEKPVGTVWVAVGDGNKIKTQRFNFRFNRSRNIEMTAVQALNLFRKYILEE